MGIITKKVFEAGIPAAEIMLAAVCGCLVLSAARVVYERLPACWLCDYDEQPWEMHMPGFRGQGCGWFYAGFLPVLTFFFYGIQPEVMGSWVELRLAVVQLSIRIVVATCAVIISLSDRDYMIVPDQLTAIIGIGAIASRCSRIVFNVLQDGSTLSCAVKSSGFSELLFGAAAGAGVMLFSSVMGMVAGKGAACGFGDVKLMAVCGAVAGERILVMYVLMAMLSGIYFSVGVLTKKIRYGSGQPLAPWICIAMMLCGT